MLVGGVFFAGLLAYGLASHRFDARSITPQAALLVLGLATGLILRDPSSVAGQEELLQLAGEAALILCLFVDAARIDFGSLRGMALLPVRLLTIGLPLTIVAGVLVARIVFPDLAWADAILLALLLAPTDAALGALVVTSPGVPVRIRQALNVESGLNDGLVTPLVLVAAALIAAGTGSPDRWILDAVRQIVLGTAAGIAVGGGSAVLLRRARRAGWMDDGSHWIAAPAVAALTWIVANEMGGNAFVAAFVAGLATSAVVGRVERDFLEFGEIGGELLGLGVFFLVGVLLSEVGGLGPMPVVYAALSLTLIRMLPVAIALVGTHLRPATVLFMGWFGPRGLASVVLALVAIEEVESAGGGIAPVVLATTLVAIAGSVLAHGLSAGPAVRAYGARVARLPTGAAELGPAADLHARGRTIAGARPSPPTARTAATDAP